MHGVLEGRGGYPEGERLLGVVVFQRAVDEAGHEGVAATNAVHNGLDVVGDGFEELLALVVNAFQAVVRSAVGFAAGSDDLLDLRKPRHHLPGHRHELVVGAGFGHDAE